MSHRLQFVIAKQPDDVTCGPTCLQAVYQYFGDDVPLDEIIRDVTSFDEGGTLAVMLGCHALRRGYNAVIYTFNLQVFDPTWFLDSEVRVDLRERIAAQMAVKDDPKLRTASEHYLEYLSLGGIIRMEDLTTGLIRKYLKRDIPVLTGLSSTYLYQESRETAADGKSDDLRGEPAGHFVVMCGYDHVERNVLVADPYLANPISGTSHYSVDLDRAMCSILLGIVTYDANLLIIRPGDRFKAS